MAKKKESAPEVKLTKSQDVIESYTMITSRRNFSIYSERLLMQIVAIAQQQMAGVDFKHGTDIGQVSVGTLGDVSVEIPIKSILPNSESSNYTQAKEAVMELMHSPYSVEQPKLNRFGQPMKDKEGNEMMEFRAYQILNKCEVNVKPGYAVLEVNKETWRTILDFSKGFRKYDLIAASSLSKKSSLRLLQLLSNQKYPITYTIRQLREMWGMEDKYPKTTDFIKRTIDPAKEEMDKSSPWTFTYTKNYAAGAEENKGRRGKKEITSITFTPVEKMANMATTDLMKMVSTPKSRLGEDVYNMLLNEFDFTAPGVKNNWITFETALSEGMDLFTFLQDIRPQAKRAKSPQGYVIRAIEKKLLERYHVQPVREGYAKKD